MFRTGFVYLGCSRDADDRIDAPQYLALKYANRHGLVTGATGTGKTVSLQILAEGFSRAGVPVFCADVKGDLSGIADGRRGEGFPAEARRRRSASPRTTAAPRRRRSSGTFSASRATRSAPPSSEMGPLLLSRLMDLNPPQEGVLNIAFKIADEEKLLAPRPEGPAGAARRHRRARQGYLGPLRQRLQGLRRRHPAPAAGAREAGRRAFLRRAGACRSAT